MISLELAQALQRSGVVWHPRTGDRFTILQPEMTGDVFTISDMMIEAHEFSTGTVLGFNGTTEWALDSVGLDQAVWLPREDQLRELLGDRLESLRRVPQGWEVTYAVSDGTRHTVTDADVECAYARALLTL